MQPQIQVHAIDTESEDSLGIERQSFLFPIKSSINNISCMNLTSDFLIYGADCGTIHYVHLEEMKIVCEHRHRSEMAPTIKSIWPQPLDRYTAGGSDSTGKIIFIDDNYDAFLYYPAMSQVIDVEDPPTKVAGILWDLYPANRGVFIAHNQTLMKIYVYYCDTIEGAKVELLGETKIPVGQYPILLHDGLVTCQTESGKLASVQLSTHLPLNRIDQLTKGELKETVKTAIALRSYKEAWQICDAIDEEEVWTNFAKSAMFVLDIDIAERVYSNLAHPAKVQFVRSLRAVEDRNLLCGHIALHLLDFDLAQKLYLSSSDPSAALDMRCDLLQWDIALSLAKSLDTDRLRFINKQFAQQLEFVGEYSKALSHYELAVVVPDEITTENKMVAVQHNASCQAGIARTAIRCGDIRRGMHIVTNSGSNILKRECADILQAMKQFAEAAILYEQCSSYDNAAVLYLRLKNWQKIGELLPNITSPKIHLQYAKAKESDGKYKEAAAAYCTAGDYDSAVRLNLDNLKNVSEAVKIARETKSVEAAKLVAKFFIKLNDYPSAIQFLILSKCKEEAFQMAKQHGQIDVYAEIIENEASEDDYISIAHHYDAERNGLMAGKFFFLAKQYQTALKQLLKVATVSDDTQALQMAIEVAASSPDDQITTQLKDYLLGEIDGVPKDPKYLFRLYMAKGQYREAAKTAVIIASEEQNQGNYRSAHDLLFSMYRELTKRKMQITAEMQVNLMILHSYILAKVYSNNKDHLRAAKMLKRIGNNIGKFPAHTVQILTSVVIECSKAGMKNTAFKFASMLLRPEHRNRLEGKYKKIIENVVRKPVRTEDVEPTQPCPFCAEAVPETDLTCSGCKSAIPYCVASGKHVVADDVTQCHNCQFPAILEEFHAYLRYDTNCPMCTEALSADKLMRVQFQSILNSAEDEAKED